MIDACYADAGYYTRMHWDKVTDGSRGTDWDQFLSKVRGLPNATRFRHNVAGDLWTTAKSKRIDLTKLRGLAKSSKHLDARWTYTHHPRTPANLHAVRTSNRLGFTVNLSCESRGDAAHLARQGLPVTCVIPSDAKPTFRHEDVPFVQSPATRDGSTVTCETCGGPGGKPLCSIADRDFVITFPAHGSRSSRLPATCS